jgi:hypothetical protein
MATVLAPSFSGLGFTARQPFAYTTIFSKFLPIASAVGLPERFRLLGLRQIFCCAIFSPMPNMVVIAIATNQSPRTPKCGASQTCELVKQPARSQQQAICSSPRVDLGSIVKRSLNMGKQIDILTFSA